MPRMQPDYRRKTIFLLWTWLALVALILALSYGWHRGAMTRHTPNLANSDQNVLSSRTVTNNYPETPIAPPEHALHQHHPSNPDLENFLDPQATTRIPDDFWSRIPLLTDQQDILAVADLLRRPAEDDAVRNVAISLLKRSGYEPLVPELMQVLDNSQESERFRSFVTQHFGLYLVDPTMDAFHASLSDRLLRALSDDQKQVRREALLGLVRANSSTALKIVRDGLSDQNWTFARDLIIHCAFEQRMRDLIPDIRKFLHSDDPDVRIAALNVLGDWKDEQSRGAFEEARLSSTIRIKQAAILSLQHLDSSKDANGSLRE